MIRILIADDHAVVRTGLQLIFDATPDLELAGELSSTHDLMEQLGHSHYDLLILDLALPGRDTLDVLKDLRIRYPELPVIIFSMYPEEQYARRYLRAGASAFLNKERPAEVLINAVRAAVRGHTYMPPGQVHSQGHSAPAESQELSPSLLLSDREFQVLRLLAEGRKKDEIAQKLSISKNTVSNHRNNILKKLHLSNNTDLTRYAIRHGLVQ
jgi:two-component system, NarL family, invasion response regulator UvrY